MSMDITKQLWNELESKTPNEEKIHELVTQGADIKGEFMEELVWLIYAPDTWEERGGDKGLDVKFVQLMIDLGGEVNYKNEENVNCLWRACDTYRPELVEEILLMYPCRR